MTRRAATIQGLLALAGLFAAYLTWQREPSLDTGEAYVLDINKNELTAVRYEELEQVAKPTDAPAAADASKDKQKAGGAALNKDVVVRDWVELSSIKDPNGPVVWVRFAGKEGSNVALPSGHPVVQTAVPERQLRGNESALKMWEGFTPWKATRALGVLEGDKLKDLGLLEPKRRIKVTFKGVTRSYSLVPAPPGGTDPYVRDEEDGRVYIVARQLLTDFQAAKSNLVEKRLHGFAVQDIDRLVITAGDKKKEFQFRRFEGRPGGELLPTGSDKADQTAGNWHDRVFALFPAEVFGKDEKPAGGAPKTSVRIDYFYRGKPLGWVELARPEDAAAGGSGAAGQQAYARSEFTAGWVSLSADALNLVSEGQSLFGGGT